MSHNRQSTSILQFLTHKNPEVTHVPSKNRTNTRNQDWHVPGRILPWKDFQSNILEAIYNGSLFEELRQPQRMLPHFPTISQGTDCIIEAETNVIAMYEKWNKTIITAALGPVQQKFGPARGVSRKQPIRRSSKVAKQAKKRSLARLRPDSGSVSWNSTLPATDPAHDSLALERFPKEFKPAFKWSSEKFFAMEVLDENGAFGSHKEVMDVSMPIRQAYTYCIQNLCRYGCILTCKEAFVFRVRPLEDEPSDSSVDADKKLEEGLIRNGLMEYHTIPWSNHYKDDSSSCKSWTVNLALWFLHILAGNQYKVWWKYDELVGETIAPQLDVGVSASDVVPVQEHHDTEDPTSRSQSPRSEATVALDDSVGKKRRWDAVESEDDPIHSSFSKRSFTIAV
ncbi:hypothetical protein S40288_09557 [Stachybotrys chartarum IBT 40288]|nr:hypothetical protein S40288_09557 [Stachybotrys chartarum IBT 40288]